jgi:pimeloyl-ACP methyl ester carboxylesterase
MIDLHQLHRRSVHFNHGSGQARAQAPRRSACEILLAAWSQQCVSGAGTRRLSRCLSNPMRYVVSPRPFFSRVNQFVSAGLGGQTARRSCSCMGPHSLPSSGAASRHTSPIIGRDDLLGYGRSEMRPNQVVDTDSQLYVDPWLGASGQTAFYRQIAQMDQRYTDEIESLYGEMRCRVRIIWGEQDAWIPVERERELANRIAGSDLRVVPEAGPLVQEDAPEALVAALLSSPALQR